VVVVDVVVVEAVVVESPQVGGAGLAATLQAARASFLAPLHCRRHSPPGRFGGHALLQVVKVAAIIRLQSL
jgi:hypothetical protein